MSLNFTMSDLEYFDNDEWFEYADNTNSYVDLGLVVGKMSKPLMPQVQESTQDVPGMYGDVYLGNDYGEMTITIPVTLMAFDHTSFNIIVENLRAMFTADANNEGIEYPIVFGDRPEVKYYGHWGQMSDPQFLTPGDWQANAQLTFICSRPYGYLQQQTVHLTHPDQPIIPQGNATTYPVYKIHLNQDIYGLGFVNSNDGGYVATGYQSEGNHYEFVDYNNTDDEGNRIQNNVQLDTDEEPTILSDWIASGTENKQIMTFQIDGDQAGQMGENAAGGICPAYTTHIDKNRTNSSQKQTVLNYGNPKDHKNWYGPLAIHPQFDNPTDDWKLMVELFNQKTSTDHTSDRAMGHLEIYLLDENGHRRGKIWIHDWQKGMMPRVGFSLGKSISDEVDLLNMNDASSNNSIGPARIGNYNVQRDRPTPRKGFVIKSLESYKKLVVNKKRSKKRKVNKKLRKNRRDNATKRHKVTISRNKKKAEAASLRKYGNRRHVHHRYTKHRKER